MSEPFLSEIRMFGFNFPPRNWNFCNGQLLSIGQNQALYSLLGTTYGGDGRTDFALPELRGRTPISFGSGYPQGAKDGAETVSMTASQLPSHRHDVNCSTTESSSRVPTNQFPAQIAANFNVNGYQSQDNSTTFAGNALQTSGSGAGQNLMQPFLAINFCICVTGTFPPRN